MHRAGQGESQRENIFRREEFWCNPGPPRVLAPPGVTTYLATLGTGTPNPNPHRSGPSGAVIANETPYLIDAGEGLLRAIARTATAHDGRFVDSLAPFKLSCLFLTHLHSDHTSGLPALLLSPFGRSQPLQVYGPPGTKRFVETLLDSYSVDIHERLHGPEHNRNVAGFQADAHEISADGPVYEDENIAVEAFHHEHGALRNYGYRFTTHDRVVVWAGDGKPGDSYRKAAQDADLLVSELCTWDHFANASWAGETREDKERVIWAYHTKPQQLAELAKEASVKRLVLIHQMDYASPYDPLRLVGELRQFYRGDVVSSRDGDIF
jgi:ribonuclease BN (tRNA processing enzyme)